MYKISFGNAVQIIRQPTPEQRDVFVFINRSTGFYVLENYFKQIPMSCNSKYKWKDKHSYSRESLNHCKLTEKDVPITEEIRQEVRSKTFGAHVLLNSEYKIFLPII